MAAAGAPVALFDIQEEKLERVAQKIKDRGGAVSTHIVDVSNSEEVGKAVESILEEQGKIDCLINNAGIVRDTLLMRMSEEDWDLVLKVNLSGVFTVTKAVVRSMVSNRYGRIVNISSVVGLMGNPGQANYSASKAGVIGFTKTLAREVSARGITVNAVAPGYIDTPMTRKLPESVKNAFLELIPMKRLGQPDEVAHVVKFLLSEEAAYITGQVISVNGGLYM
jgi:3-oxoacyl-[acyl-carrier protein] reductase